MTNEQQPAEAQEPVGEVYVSSNGERRIAVIRKRMDLLEDGQLIYTSPPARASAAPQEHLCACKDRPASECPGEWEQGCDLGANPKYVRTAPQDRPNEAVMVRSIYDRLQSVLCDPEGKCCISGSNADRYIVDVALADLAMLAAATHPQAPSTTSDDVRELEKLRACIRGLESANGELEYSIQQQESAWKQRAEKAEAAIADAHDKALEEAAKVCDGITHQYTSSGGHAAERCAAAIRALRTNSEK